MACRLNHIRQEPTEATGGGDNRDCGEAAEAGQDASVKIVRGVKHMDCTTCRNCTVCKYAEAVASVAERVSGIETKHPISIEVKCAYYEAQKDLELRKMWGK